MKKILKQKPATPLQAKSTENPRFSKKDFRESPQIEQFYKTIYEHKLREQAYKIAIEVYLSRKA